jgi:hypothetical protein
MPPSCDIGLATLQLKSLQVVVRLETFGEYRSVQLAKRKTQKKRECNRQTFLSPDGNELFSHFLQEIEITRQEE